ncbi:subtilisin-like protease SBT1.5 [Humulus lupulus]|uniref:subtilisin-like protease SBT1.5 n=1 Tax=Humulus lupulus TaxID=3486 RepID=UPI002B40A77A|nr:subtilisin-like protease SBT1.5 [Humulus lupulus]
MAMYFPLVFLSLLLVSGQIISSHETKTTYIVQVQNDLNPSSNHTDVVEWYSSILRSLKASASNEPKVLDFLHIYRTIFHGFSAKLTKEQAIELETRPNIAGVFPDRVRQLHTTRSPEFLGLVVNRPNGLLKESNWGSNVIIGVIDTGVWPEGRSFHDKGLGPVPSQWKGQCVAGDQFPATLCNKKLIGARYYYSGYAAQFGGENLVKSARDEIGHGTHTSSTAAGRGVENVSLFGYAKGNSQGMAPKARLAIYKVCWEDGCATSDVLAAIDDAVKDGVDVISISLGGDPMPYDIDPIAIAGFGATRNGVVVSASAGNSGPELESVSNAAPWITTVGAGTLDRKFPAEVLLGDGSIFTGSSLYSGKPLPAGKLFPIIYAGDAALRKDANDSDTKPQYCFHGSLDPKLVKGKIVVCDAAGLSPVEKGVVVKEAGGVGVVVGSDPEYGDGLLAEAFMTPGLTITDSARATIAQYISSSDNPRATLRFSGTKLGVKPAPLVAFFSSRGPNSLSPYVLKPDLIAPGVEILAAWPDNIPPTWYYNDTRKTKFNIISGTSMSCPHVSGIAALLKGVHPEWTPAMVKSAMMTTAYMNDRDGKPLREQINYTLATPWLTGAGHVDPEKAMDPGLVYDLTVEDCVSFLCSSNYSDSQIKMITGEDVKCIEVILKNTWDLNYPAIVVPLNVSEPSKSKVSVPRTVTHVSDGACKFTVKVTSPRGTAVRVVPEKMEFKKKGEKERYVVKIAVDEKRRRLGKPGGSAFGRLTWTCENYHVNSPLVVTWVD